MLRILVMCSLFGFLVGIGTLAGCEEQGPMERAGERADEAAEDAADAVEDAGDEIEDAADEVEDAVDDSNP